MLHHFVPSLFSCRFLAPLYTGVFVAGSISRRLALGDEPLDRACGDGQTKGDGSSDSDRHPSFLTFPLLLPNIRQLPASGRHVLRDLTAYCVLRALPLHGLSRRKRNDLLSKRLEPIDRGRVGGHTTCYSRSPQRQIEGLGSLTSGGLIRGAVPEINLRIVNRTGRKSKGREWPFAGLLRWHFPDAVVRGFVCMAHWISERGEL